MTALRLIEAGLVRIGYRPEAIIRDYTFADVLSPKVEAQRVDLAAFTHTPESFRSAAFGVVTSGFDTEGEVVARRALGAPIFFSIDAEGVTVWQVGAETRPRALDRVGLGAIDDLFGRNADRWHPQAVHRAKSLGSFNESYQLDFVDLGLMPAIEQEVQAKLDRLLSEVIKLLLPAEPERTPDVEKAAFRTTFRLLAAKILQDRRHPDAEVWNRADVASVLRAIEIYYRLPHIESGLAVLPQHSLDRAWKHLSSAPSVRNISADSLAFVYENTLVAADTRKLFSTHSTPRRVAEYVLERIDLSRFDRDRLRIFEPFTGAGIFLVSALRHLRDLLPPDWSAEERHHYLTARITGSEIDLFACEVATLSLILADYPNANGWQITCEDLFAPAVITRAAAGATVTLCNPPFEDFTAEERVRYPDAFRRSFSKPMMVLGTVLDCRPEAIGFVLPQGFLRQRQYAELRERVARTYGSIELVSLPDRLFEKAGYESALLIATELRRGASTGVTKLSSVTVDDADRLVFLQSGRTSATRHQTRVVRDDRLWVGALDELWEHLARNPQLDDVAEIYRGLKWWRQKDGISTEPKEGFRRGVYRPAESLQPFRILRTVWLNFAPETLMYPGPPGRPWHLPKVLANNQRRSRGPWRLSAAFDTSGLAASQHFFGIWPKKNCVSGEALEAILNGPLANAYLTEHSTKHDFTNETLGKLPIPEKLCEEAIRRAVNRYREALGKVDLLGDVDHELLNRLLIDIDAQVLRSYDLPPRLERRLLEYFRGHRRPVAHAFEHWFPEELTAFIPLHEYAAPEFKRVVGSWILDVFTPAPPEEAEALAHFLD
jgi:hypothetical protein